MTWAMHCDNCGHWQKESSGPTTFLSVIPCGSDYAIAHVCCVDCLMHWAAKHSAPTVRVED
jgi:hypothetical protein